MATLPPTLQPISDMLRPPANRYELAYNLLTWEILKAVTKDLTKHQLKEEILKAMANAQGELT